MGYITTDFFIFFSKISKFGDTSIFYDHSEAIVPARIKPQGMQTCPTSVFQIEARPLSTAGI